MVEMMAFQVLWESRNKFDFGKIYSELVHLFRDSHSSRRHNWILELFYKEGYSVTLLNLYIKYSS